MTREPSTRFRSPPPALLAAAVAGAILVSALVAYQAGRSALWERLAPPGGAGGREPPARGLSCADCNLLLLSIDTLRADRLGFYGHTRPTSPHLDALAAESLVFRDVLAQAPTTRPSHASIFSGRYVFEHRDDLNAMPVMAELLAEAGFRTAAFVDGGQLNERFGLSKGFDEWIDVGDRSISKVGRAGGGLRAINPRLVAWLSRHASERFFVFVQTYDVHCPYTPPEPFFSMFTGDYEPDFEVEGRCGLRYFDSEELGPEGFAYIAALYDGGIRYTDARFAEIRHALEQLDLARDTLLVVTSDHGESLGERDRIGHNEVYDVQLKVPLIVHIPGGPAAVVDEPVQSLDILPTLLALLGVDAPALPGVDLRSLVADGASGRGRVRLAEHGLRGGRSVRIDQRWSLVLEDGRPPRLFDLRADPAEEHDLFVQQPRVAARLLDAYRQLGVVEGDLPALPDDLDAHTRARLRALGYAAPEPGPGGDPPSPDGAGADPRAAR